MRRVLGQTAASPLALGPPAWMRASYWWYYAAIGAFTPFITLYYRGLGFSGVQIGVLAAIPPVATALLAPLLGAFADTRSAHGQVLRVSLGLTALVAILLSRAAGFPQVLGLVVLLGIAIAPIPSLLDGFGVTLSERHEIPYGRLRVWGSLGYTAAVWLIGWWMGGAVTVFFLLAYAGCILLTLGSGAGLPRITSGTSVPILQGVSSVLGNRRLLLLLAITYIVSTGTGMMYNYFGLYFFDIGGNARLLGTALALTSLSELPVMAFGGRLLHRLGPLTMLRIAIAAYIVRLAAYGTLTDPTWVLPVQLLHGLCFAMYLMASVTLAHRLAGRELAATAQGLLTGVSFGLGSLTGSLTGGVLLEQVGTMGIFRLATVGMVVALAVLLTSGRTLVPRSSS
ncbi:MAG: MFS transporter [Chloroflexota bacterium]|nr:MFS transporter [Chloroflexota bacterium]